MKVKKYIFVFQFVKDRNEQLLCLIHGLVRPNNIELFEPSKIEEIKAELSSLVVYGLKRGSDIDRLLGFIQNNYIILYKFKSDSIKGIPGNGLFQVEKLYIVYP